MKQEPTTYRFRDGSTHILGEGGSLLILDEDGMFVYPGLTGDRNDGEY